jgi:multiple sugar transport system permease protein
VGGLVFVAPFLLVFAAFLVAPLAYAAYLSLFTKGLATGHELRGTRQLHPGPSPIRPSSRASGSSSGFSLVLIPLQMLVSLVARARARRAAPPGSPASPA